MSSLLDNLGQLHIFTASVAANGESMTTNDGSATIATNGVGDFTITWGEAFLSAPVVVATALDPTYSATTDGAYNASITAVTTTTLQIQTADTGDNAADGAAVDAICHIIAIGLRDN
jgi:hypothetical protein